MEEDKKRKVTIDIVKANVFAVIIMVAAAVVLLVPFFMIWGFRQPEDIFGGIWGVVMVPVALFVGIAVHELIHGITWACFTKSGWRSIHFGVMWKLLTPYCHCSEPQPIPAYMWGALMPCIVLGIIPSIVSLCIGSLLLAVWGIFFISAAAGDIWIAWLLTKEKRDSTVLDHPSEAGFYIIEPDDEPDAAAHSDV